MFIAGEEIQTTWWWLFQVSHLTRLCSSVVWEIFQSENQRPQLLPARCVGAFQETWHRHLRVLSETHMPRSELLLLQLLPHTHSTLKPVFELLVWDVSWANSEQGREDGSRFASCLAWVKRWGWGLEMQVKEEEWKNTEFRGGRLVAGDREE